MVKLWRRRVLPSADANIVESVRERLTTDSPARTVGFAQVTPEGEENEDARDTSTCSNVASAVSRAVAALDLGRPDAAKQELLGLLRTLWGIDGTG
jgi:hypothetical protein